jgi:hypothetical protein
MAHSYEDHNHDPTPYASGDGFYNQSSGYYPPQPKKKSVSNWVKIGIPVLVLVIGGAVAGAVLATRAKNNSASASSAAGGSGGSAGGSGAPGNGIFATATNANGWPVYPSATNAAAFSLPTFAADAANKWPADPQTFDAPSLTNIRPDHPRLIAPTYKWDALPKLIKADPYMKFWDSQIMAFAAQEAAAPPIPYDIDGGLDKSGVLDPARHTKRRIKALCYAYRMTKETKWVDRIWQELVNASGNSTTQAFGTRPDNWNTAHFLDVAEFTSAFAIAYDWLYDIWTDVQKNAIMWSILDLGLKYGLAVHTGTNGNPGYGWWKNNVNGNWNCVCNGGMILGSLAIMEDDPTGIAAQLLPLAVKNAAGNCAMGPSSDGTWSETANYWYFGTTGYAELTSALLTATGGDFDMLGANPAFKLTGLYHMHVSGMTSMFNYGDHGPNKFSTTANSMMFMGSAFNNPAYTLFQRDRNDSPEPWSMFWYDPSVKGAWWDGLELDHYFNDPSDLWVSMRSSWTDNNGLYLAMKAGGLENHQTHGDLDAGDFVIDALGVQWAGEYGSADYLGNGYFSNETQSSLRWLWYRKMTEGQNTITVDGANQLVAYVPVDPRFDTSKTAQGSSTVMDVPADSTAFFTVDLSSAYGAGTTFKRGVRMINGRRQILLQDEITTTAPLQWRMQTNATITPNGPSATLTIDDKTMMVQLLNPPAGAAFSRSDPVRTTKAPQLAPGQEPDQPNPGASVLIIELPAGTYNLQVLFNPQWDNFKSFQTPPTVNLADWTLTSHNT